jgi:hypothetical protein
VWSLFCERFEFPLFDVLNCQRIQLSNNNHYKKEIGLSEKQFEGKSATVIGSLLISNSANDQAKRLVALIRERACFADIWTY